MHEVTVPPGFSLLTLYIAEPASLSARTTVPDANRLLSFDVVLENAENDPTPARADTEPTTINVRRIFLTRVFDGSLSTSPPRLAPGMRLASPTWLDSA